MKSIFYIFVVSLILLACGNTKPKVDYTIVSGTITNPNQEEIRFNGVKDGKPFSRKIKVAKDGTFRDTLQIDEGTCSMYAQGHKVSKMRIVGGASQNEIFGFKLYLKKGDVVTINFDAKDFYKTFKVTGDGAGYANYKNEKKNIENTVFGNGIEAYAQDEDAFKQKVTELKSKHENLLNNAAIDIDNYKLEQLRELNYEYLLRINSYQTRHGYLLKNKDFKVSDEFLNELDELAYNNEYDYKNSNSYRMLFSARLEKLAIELSEKEGTSKLIAKLKVISNSEIESIKNELLKNHARSYIIVTDDIDAFYNEFMKYSTNESNNSMITEMYTKTKKLAKGSASPKFKDYENYAGGTTSLDDLKGKYVYIDVWATWCGPCKAEIPFLAKVEKEYHGKNIHFVSISIDKKKDYDVWRKMIADKELSGIQLLADNDVKSEFYQQYGIKGIPRFILIDPIGNIVSSNAPRPSNPKLIELLNQLDI